MNTPFHNISEPPFQNFMDYIFVIPAGHNFVGICSICGGHVISPIYWSGGCVPPSTCMECGATEKKKIAGPNVIEMEPAGNGHINVPDMENYV